MEFDSIRPVISGIVGGIIATWLTSRWARTLPDSYNRKSRDTLLRQHRASIWTANVLFFAGLCFGIALYRIGGFASTDWRPMLWGFGLASVLPLLAIAVVSQVSGRSTKEAYVAFAWGQGSPLLGDLRDTRRGFGAFLFAVAGVGT